MAVWLCSEDGSEPAKGFILRNTLKFSVIDAVSAARTRSMKKQDKRVEENERKSCYSVTAGLYSMLTMFFTPQVETAVVTVVLRPRKASTEEINFLHWRPLHRSSGMRQRCLKATGSLEKINTS